MSKPLSPEPARTLTDRECVKILGGTIGGLVDMADVETVRNAVRWWAESEDGWTIFAELEEIKRLGRER